MELIIFGVILALSAGVVYAMRRNANLENEKAALENSKTARDTKIQLLENERLKNEQRLRDEERRLVDQFEAVDDTPDDAFGGSFYHRVREDKNRLN